MESDGNNIDVVDIKPINGFCADTGNFVMDSPSEILHGSLSNLQCQDYKSCIDHHHLAFIQIASVFRVQKDGEETRFCTAIY